jgi:simple sugar transport system permease protein
MLQLLFGEGSNTPGTPGFTSAVVGNPLVWLTLAAAIVVPIAVARTRWGLRLRAAGDRPDALVSVGVEPARARYAAGLVGGALCGAGGAQLSLAVFGFTADVTVGRGYMVLAMVILAGWRAGWTVAACLGIVAAAEAFNIQLQVVNVGVPRELAPLLPHVITMVVLFFAGGRIPPPRSLGRV